jgi:hypothetical protein
LAETRSVTVNLLTVSGKKEFRQRFSRSRAQGALRTKPGSVAFTKSQEIAVYQHDVTAVFSGNRMIFGLTQLLEIASCPPDCVIYSQA